MRLPEKRKPAASDRPDNPKATPLMRLAVGGEDYKNKKFGCCYVEIFHGMITDWGNSCNMPKLMIN